MYTPLLIEYDYKVINNASGQIVRTFWESVPEDLLSPIIVCAKNDSPFKSKWPVYEFKEYKFLTKLGHALRKTPFPDLSNQPDMFWHLWGKNVLRNIEKSLKSQTFDYIHSISCPMGSHLVAMEIKRRTGVPWVAQFHDPWIGNRSEPFLFPYFQKRFENMEYEIAVNADYIIHTNPIIVNNWKKRYGSIVENKIISLPLSFNIPHLPIVQGGGDNKGKIVISHIGEIYDTRSIKDIVDALVELISEDNTITSKVEIRLIGRVSRKEIEYIKYHNLENVFKFIGVLPPEELLVHYNDTDVFLAIDLNRADGESFPSKLMMYYYYQKPILGISLTGSIMMDDLHKSKHKCFCYNDVVGIKQYLYSVVNKLCDFSSFDKNYWKRYTVESAISDYMQVVKSII